MERRPLVVSVDRLHKMSQRREETRVARYDLLVGSVSRVITRAVNIDPTRTSVFVSLGMIIGRETSMPGMDISTAIEYITMVLKRNGFTCTHIGGGVLLITWPPAPSLKALQDLQDSAETAEANRRATAREIARAEQQAAIDAAAAVPLQAARNTLDDIRRVAAKYAPAPESGGRARSPSRASH